MDKYSVDFTSLNNDLSRPKYYKYSDVKEKLVKVAFDVVRFMDSEDIDGLWQVQKTDDGEVIVAMYETEPVKAAKASWDALSDKTGSTVNVFYKGTPVTKIALASAGIPRNDAGLVCETLPRKLASDSSFRKSMLNELSEKDRLALLSEYPELRE